MTRSPSSFLAVVGLALVLFACAPKENQQSAEHRAAHDIILMLQMYDIDHPGVRVTNLAQLFHEPGRTYPYAWHQRFEKFGRHSGFSASVYEKYVFPAPGITNRLFLGEIVFLNARPYPGPSGPGRIITSKVGPQHTDYRRQWLPENQIQQVFSAGGLAVPTTAPMPAPPPAPINDEFETPMSSHVWTFFDTLSEALGLGASGPLVLQAIAVAGLSCLLVAMLFLVRFSRRRRS
jgi:hypothetical protein